MWPLALVATTLAADDPFTLEATVAELANGLTVIVSEDHRTDTVALHLHYGVGSRDERHGEHGCSHLFEHLMFEGSAHVPTNRFDEWLTAAGGSNNAYTSSDETAYHMAFPSGALELALFLESDRMAFLEAGLDASNLSNQQQVVLQERAQGYAEPNGRDWDTLGRLTWPATHPYHVPVIGTVGDVEGFTLEAVVDFWQRHYRPRNAVLAVVGNVHTDEALDRVAFWFSDVPDRGAPEPRVVEQPVGNAPRVRDGVLEDEVEERTVYLTWPTVPLLHDDEPALDLLSFVLSYGRGTRLDDRLYYQSNRASDVGAFTDHMEIDGQFVVYASSDRTPLTKLARLLEKEVQRIGKRAPTHEELERARGALRGTLLEDLELPEGRAEWLVNCYRWTGDANCLPSEWERYEAVAPEDLVRVASTYLLGDRRRSLSVVPRGDDGVLSGSVAVELP